MMNFLFARAGRLLLVDLFFPKIVLASHVLGESVLCIFNNPVLRGRPSIRRRRYILGTRGVYGSR